MMGTVAGGDGRPAPPAAVRVLRRILAAGRVRRNPGERVEANESARDPAQLLPEWLALARRAGVDVPPELLPELLEVGRRNAEMRDVVTAAAGERGQWLAAMNPPWAYAAAPPADPAAAWQAGTTEARLRILRHLRRTAPATGVAVLRSTWATERNDARVLFLDALETGLSLDDEPFLESILDEPIIEREPDDESLLICDWHPPRREVRPTVVNLLAMLPGSRLVTRMFARLAPLLTLREPHGERARIVLQVPAGDDEEPWRYVTAPSWVREHTLPMRDMLELVPPSLWAAHWGRGYAELLRARHDLADDDLVIRAWTAASLRVRDGEFAEARLRMPGGKHPSVGVRAVAKAIPPDRLETLALERLSAHGLAFRGTVPELLLAARFPWGPALTRAVLEALPCPIVEDEGDRTLHITMDQSAPYMHPATAIAVFRERGGCHQGGWVDLLHVRHTLHQAF